MFPVNKLKTILVALTVLALTTICFFQPISQDPQFHQFADARQLFSIPNSWNVLSNLCFLVVGFYGLFHLVFSKSLQIISSIKISYTVFFIGISMVAFGSSYYHLNPNNNTLVWDRLPMTVAFMALLSIVLAEFVSIDWGRNSLWPLVCLGVCSVMYWHWGEKNGHGDLRPYLLVQFLPMLLLPIIFVFGKSCFTKKQGYWWVLITYLFAKLAEHFDVGIYKSTNGILAGHAIKHLLVAIGLFFLIQCFQKRKMG